MSRAPLLLVLLLLAAALASCGKGGRYERVASSTSSAPTGGSSGGGAGGSPGGTTSTAPNGVTPTTPGGGSENTPGGGAETTPSSPTTPQGSTPSEPAPREPSTSTKRALAFAQAVNLTAEDVPGFAPSDKSNSSSAKEKRLEHQMVQCAGAAGLGAAGAGVAGKRKSVTEQSSKDFELKHGIVDLSVSSEVSVQDSAADARRGLQAIRSPKVRSCFSHYLQLIFQGERVKGATAGPVSIQAGTPPAPGTSGGFGWRITASFYIKKIKVPIYLDFLGFVQGPAEVTLLSSGLLRPFPAEVQQHLFALLLSRAKEHAL
ncbi:MAG TPA: hypothetical protein VHW67_05840 [Solirubrobacteraceae bacterium]|jgi:hypothetical protein|nr:hypothetical protein [Solirubrobacteraceae bacterium]